MSPALTLPLQGAPAAGAQKFVGYKGSTQPGSAPTTRAGKPGLVYKLGMKNGKANIDEYAPIYTPNEWKFDGDKYEPGFAGLAAWAATLGAVLLGGAFAVRPRDSSPHRPLALTSSASRCTPPPPSRRRLHRGTTKHETQHPVASLHTRRGRGSCWRRRARRARNGQAFKVTWFLPCLSD